MGFAVDKMALGQDFLTVFWFYPVSIILQMLLFHLSITNATATDSVIKTDTKKKTHIPLLRLIDQTLNTEMINFKLSFNNKTLHYGHSKEQLIEIKF
jgi:hypothetical protein